MKVGQLLLWLLVISTLGCQNAMDGGHKPSASDSNFKYLKKENKVLLEKWVPSSFFSELHDSPSPDTILFVPRSGKLVYKTSRIMIGDVAFYKKKIYCDADPTILCLEVIYYGFSNERSNKQWHFIFEIEDEIETLHHKGFSSVDAIDTAEYALSAACIGSLMIKSGCEGAKGF